MSNTISSWIRCPKNNFINPELIENFIIGDKCIMIFLSRATYHFTKEENITKEEFEELGKVLLFKAGLEYRKTGV